MSNSSYLIMKPIPYGYGFGCNFALIFCQTAAFDFGNGIKN